MKSSNHSTLKTSNQVATVVFVDAGVENSQQLVNGVIPTAEVFVLDAAADGIEQISQVLQQRQNVGAVHIVSHGAPGQIFVGRSRIALNDLTEADIGRWRQSLSAEAEILLYGCNVAAGVLGRQFVERLAQLTGAAVYASNAVVGSPKRGGSWQLASVAGVIDLEALRSAFSPKVLAEYQGAFPQTINPTGGGAGSDDLGVTIYENGTFQILRNGSSQVFPGGTTFSTPNTSFGIALGVGGTTYASSNFGVLNDNPLLKLASQSLVSGVGTSASPYQVTTTLYADLNNNNTYDAATDIKVEWIASYIDPNDYFSNRFNITAPVGNTSEIKLYQHFDTYLAGDDLGPAYGLTASGTALTGTTDNPKFIGVQKNAGTPSQVQMGFIEDQGEFSQWYSGNYSTPANQVDNGGNLTNTYNTNAGTDNGLAVQYDFGALAGTTTISNVLAFSAEAIGGFVPISRWDFVTRDYNLDGGTDVVAIVKNDTGSGTTEVHIMDRATNYQSWLLHTGTALHETGDNWDFVKGDGNRDGATDILAIKKSDTVSGTTEVHILNAATNYQSWVFQTKTALHETGADWDFQATDINRDGITDIVALKKSGTDSTTTEVHVLNGATDYQSFLFQTPTALHQTDNNWDFQVGDCNDDGITDIVALKKSGTDSTTTEVHVLNGATNYQSFLFQTKTALHQTDNNWDFVMDDYDSASPVRIIGLKESGTDTNTTEAHILNASINYQDWLFQTPSILPEVGIS